MSAQSVYHPTHRPQWFLSGAVALCWMSCLFLVFTVVIAYPKCTPDERTLAMLYSCLPLIGHSTALLLPWAMYRQLIGWHRPYLLKTVLLFLSVSVLGFLFSITLYAFRDGVSLFAFAFFWPMIGRTFVLNMTVFLLLQQKDRLLTAAKLLNQVLKRRQQAKIQP